MGEDILCKEENIPLVDEPWSGGGEGCKNVEPVARREIGVYVKEH